MKKYNIRATSIHVYYYIYHSNKFIASQISNGIACNMHTKHQVCMLMRNSNLFAVIQFDFGGIIEIPLSLSLPHTQKLIQIYTFNYASFYLKCYTFCVRWKLLIKVAQSEGFFVSGCNLWIILLKYTIVFIIIHQNLFNFVV